MISTKSNIKIGNYQNPEYSLTSRAVGNKTDVRLNKKEMAKPVNYILLSAAVAAGLGVAAYYLKKRF